jgi:hypothetical protein
MIGSCASATQIPLGGRSFLSLNTAPLDRDVDVSLSVDGRAVLDAKISADTLTLVARIFGCLDDAARESVARALSATDLHTRFAIARPL